VLWLTKGLGRGGAERLLVEMADGFDSDSYRIDVAYVMPVKDALVEELESLGIHVTCLGSPGDRGPRWIGRLRRLVADQQYDIIHSHMPIPAVAARVAAGGRAHIVHTEHNVWQRYRRLTRFANAVTYRRNERVIAVSQAVADSVNDRFLRSGTDRLIVVRHGLRLAGRPAGGSRADARRLLGLPADALVIGTVGNLTPKKGHAILIEAFSRLHASRTDSRLVIVGTGPEHEHLRIEVASRGLEDSVLMTGSRGDVPDLLPAFDIYASASLFEGLPIALVEAFAAGLPVVATTAGGTGEVLNDGVEGVLVDPGDVDALAKALDALAGDPERRASYGAAATRRSRDFDVSRAVGQIQRIYDEVTLR
jgi:glycosyltransferase involved in cell wall biosynthesis